LGTKARIAAADDEQARGGRGRRQVTRSALEEARALLWQHRTRLGLGLSLMLVSRLAGLVLPATSKFLLDDPDWVRGRRVLDFAVRFTFVRHIHVELERHTVAHRTFVKHAHSQRMLRRLDQRLALDIDRGVDRASK
jgi:hypothetical protein